jgi:hypothetical protein
MGPKTLARFTTRLRAAAVAALAAALLFGGPPAFAQAKKPITKEGLLKAVRINGLSTAELVQQIEQRGVSFQMSAADEQELRAAGARPEVLDAARANYRGAAMVPASASRTAVPAGPPLTKTEVVTTLQGGAPPARVEQMVEARGVNFRVTPAVANEIKQAGGDNSLVGAITAAYTTRAKPAPARPAPPVAEKPKAPDYDDLTDEATAAYESKNAARAAQLLQQAIQMDPAQPRAYQLLGFTDLYLRGDIASAERNMRLAVERGGSAAFRVFHDHANGSFRDTCAGTLFVTGTNVTFKADDGKDTFETLDTEIKEIKVNKLVGSAFGVLIGGAGDIGAFHIKVKRAGGDKNYNFAPLTKQKAESKLIITLVQGYGNLKG